MNEETVKEEAYPNNFEYFMPIFELGGRAGLDTNMLARSLGIRTNSLVSKMKDSDFVEATMKPYIESKQAIKLKLEKNNGFYWVLTEEASLALIAGYNTKLRLLYLKFLRDPAEKAKAEERARLEKEAAKLLEISQAAEMEESLSDCPVNRTEYTALLRRVIAAEKQLAEYRKPIKTYPNLAGDFKNALRNRSWEITKIIANPPGINLQRDNVQIPVMRRILRGCANVFGKPCEGFLWEELSIIDFPLLRLLMLTYKIPEAEYELVREEILKLPVKTCQTSTANNGKSNGAE